ncbi:hypothetical protein DSO57_1006389 [Entomophthora muscae]|uniref:Uncharacterized protein n=1 Tax=Entomophthora muscae TaxID=34485 RepID=A0ACC2SWW6_9FUNG|nr:hypothetical protein DSO57_1006389 [Entomophthora muscae]
MTIVKIITKDGKSHKVEHRALYCSGLLMRRISGDCELIGRTLCYMEGTPTLNLPEVKSKEFKKILEYCYQHIEDYVQPWDSYKNMSWDLLFVVMDKEPLLDLAKVHLG